MRNKSVENGEQMNMEYNLETAIEQMRRSEEPGLNYIYSKTYNYVYLRTKSILKKESDIHQLMQEVYLKALASSAELEKECLYEWLGKCVYTLGCQWYRKKKAREAASLEIDKNEFTARKSTNLESTMKMIEQCMEELPDLYQATFYAFYYDYMSVEEIAKVMDCTEGTIINRLNYTRKYMVKALENLQEEKKEKVSFSVEVVCMTLRKWSVDHCLGMTTAQSVYTEICKKANMKAGSIYLEGKEFAGVNNTVVYHKTDDLAVLEEQFAKYAPKPGVDKKKLGVAAGVVALVIAVIVGIALFVTPEKENTESQPESVQKEEQQKEEQQKEEQQEEGQMETGQEEPEPQDQPQEEPVSTEDEYILPESNTRKLTREELEPFTKEQLRLARNEIFARHGMIFGVEDLDNYFKTKSWYQPTIPGEDFMEQVEMSLIEEANVVLILEVESEK